jgi:hypothetical protein
MKPQDETRDVLVGVAGESERADLANKDVLHSREKRIRLALEPGQSQLSVLNEDAVYGLDLIAHKCPRVHGQLCRSGFDDVDRLVDLRLAPSKDCSRRLGFPGTSGTKCRSRWSPPGNIGNVKVRLCEWLQWVELVVTEIHLERAVLQ